MKQQAREHKYRTTFLRLGAYNDQSSDHHQCNSCTRMVLVSVSCCAMEDLEKPGELMVEDLDFILRDQFRRYTDWSLWDGMGWGTEDHA